MADPNPDPHDGMAAHPAARPRTHGALWGWAQLLRLPNLFTVPGDPLAGAMLALAAGGTLSWSGAGVGVGAALLIYAGGLVLNDWFDLDRDTQERPHRPLPAKCVSPAWAAVVGWAFLAGGVAWAFTAGMPTGAVALLLAAFAAGYDAGLKDVPWLGATVMGLCRGGSLVLGVLASGGIAPLAHPAVWGSAAALTVYIAAVTRIASRETRTVRIGLSAWLPAAAVVAWAYLLVVYRVPRLPENWTLPETLACKAAFYALAMLAVGYAAHYGRAVSGRAEPEVVQRSIGGFIRNLMFLQALAAMAAVQPGAIVACAIVAARVPAGWAAKKFYGS